MLPKLKGRFFKPFGIRHKKDMSHDLIVFNPSRRFLKGFVLVGHALVRRVRLNDLERFDGRQVWHNCHLMRELDNRKVAIQKKPFRLHDKCLEKLFQMLNGRSHRARGIEKDDPRHTVDVYREAIMLEINDKSLRMLFGDASVCVKLI